MPEDSSATVSAPSTGAPADGTGQITNHFMGRDNQPSASDRDVSQRARPTNASESNGEGKAPEKKELSRYERTKRQRIGLQQREAALQQRERQFAEAQRQAALAAEEARKPKRQYSLEDLKRYRSQWEQEGNFDLVEAADREIAAMQKEAADEEAKRNRTVQMPVMGTPEHKAQWEAAEKELAEADPEFMRQGTRLDTRLREIMASEEGNLYRQHPRGIVAAYHRAKLGLLEEDVKTLRSENEQLNAELKKYQGFTSIGGGSPSAPAGARVQSVGDFAKLSSKDMKKHLMANAGKGGDWI